MKVQPKPHPLPTIDAEQWEGNIESEEAISTMLGTPVNTNEHPDVLEIEVMIGTERVDLGSWVLKHSTGYVRVLSDADFREMYEEVKP